MLCSKKEWTKSYNTYQCNQITWRLEQETGYDAIVCGVFCAATNVQRVKTASPILRRVEQQQTFFKYKVALCKHCFKCFYQRKQPPLPPCSPYNYVPTGLGTRARQGLTEMTGLVAVAYRRRSRPPQQNDDGNSKKTNWKMTNWKMRSQKMKSLSLDLKRRKHQLPTVLCQS